MLADRKTFHLAEAPTARAARRFVTGARVTFVDEAGARVEGVVTGFNGRAAEPAYWVMRRTPGPGAGRERLFPAAALLASEGGR